MKIIEQHEVAGLIKDGANVAASGFATSILADHIIRGIEKSFLETGHPRDLELTTISCIGDKTPGEGMDRFAHRGLLRGLRTSHINMCPLLQKAVTDGDIYCHIYTFGALVQLMRDMGSGKPGTITDVGIGTFIDPRLEGGRANRKTKEDVAEVMDIGGSEYLFFPSFGLDVAILRGTTMDMNGNVTMEDEVTYMDILEVAQAVKRNGGIVIVQVKNLVAAGELDPRSVQLPGIMVDYAVVAPARHHMQTMASPMNEDFTQRKHVLLVDLLAKVAPMSERLAIARRAAMELRKGDTINLGMGVPEWVGDVAVQEGFFEELTMTLECGHIGGLPASGLNFGGCYNPEYVTHCSRQLDWYDGGGLDVGILSAAEVDRFGNTNVSKFGKIVGPGGYINIATGAKKMIFCGTLTTGGLKVGIGDGRLKILKEGSKKKYVSDVCQVTYSGLQALRRRRPVTYITERCVLEMRRDVTPEDVLAGEPLLELTEVAPGIDVKTQVLDQIGFEVKVSPQLKKMDPRIFTDEPMGYELPL